MASTLIRTRRCHRIAHHNPQRRPRRGRPVHRHRRTGEVRTTTQPSPCTPGAHYRDMVAASIPRRKWFIRVVWTARPECQEEDHGNWPDVAGLASPLA